MKILNWLKLLLPVFILLLFKKRARASDVVHFLDPVNVKQKEEFLTAAKRGDWDEKDCMSAKRFILALIEDRSHFDLVNLPPFYFHLLDDDTLNGFAQMQAIIGKKLQDEIARRAAP